MNKNYTNTNATDLNFAHLIASAAFLYYILKFPTGIFGFLLVVLAFFFVILFSNKNSFGFFALLIGSLVFGTIFQAFKIPYLGTFVSLGVGTIIVLRHKSFKYFKNKIFYSRFFMFFIFLFLVLVFAYIYGPQTYYSANKFFWFFVGLFVSLSASLFLLDNYECDMASIGVLSVAGGIVYYASILYEFPQATPVSVWSIAGMRTGLNPNEFSVATQMVSYVFVTGAVFLISSIANAKFKKIEYYVSLVYLFIALISLLSCGQRLYILAPIFGSMGLFFCRVRNTKAVLVLNLIFVLVVGWAVYVGMKDNVSYVTRIFDGESDFATRTNRNINWDAAFERIKEKPFLGHGLGGYYVDGYSSPGQGTYPHNMILEFLCETGILGTIIILGPLIYFIIVRWREILLIKTVNSQPLLPWVASVFLISMISHDLQRSSYLLGIILALSVYLNFKPSKKFERKFS